MEEFDTPAFHAALRQTMAKWRPGVVQLRFTPMAIMRRTCASARTILVDMILPTICTPRCLPRARYYQIRRQHQLWTAFETAAWSQVDRVVTMSELDRGLVQGSVAIPNGVDLERFQPSSQQPDPRRLLFIGSFAHRPNVLALEFFLRDVFPHLENVTLHVIAGQRHQRFWDLVHAGVEVEGFVSDVVSGVSPGDAGDRAVSCFGGVPMSRSWKPWRWAKRLFRPKPGFTDSSWSAEPTSL